MAPSTKEESEGPTSFEGPTFHVIVLGAGGGPSESNTTGLLVRSTRTEWSKDSILAVDAGTHLSAIIRHFEDHIPSAETIQPSPITISSSGSNGTFQQPSARRSTSQKPTKRVAKSRGRRTTTPSKRPDIKPHLRMTSGPFESLVVPHTSPPAAAAFVLRNLIATYLITHPHLDHLSGFAINTAAFQHTSRPKKLAALPSTIDAIKTHIFNDVIWPNLSDEQGVGFVSYMRLVDGGNIALGNGDARGYIEVVNGLSVKSWAVSHGHCTRSHPHWGGGAQQSGLGGPESMGTFGHPGSRRTSTAHISPSTGIRNPLEGANFGMNEKEVCVYDSSAFFVRDEETGHELLIFGDVEPDSISLSPRTERVWIDAAPKIGQGLLKAIFIECSFQDSQSDDTLFGHLAPRHLVAEMQVLAQKVHEWRIGDSKDAASGAILPDKANADLQHDTKKRKRRSIGVGTSHQEEMTAGSSRGRKATRTTRQNRKPKASTTSPDEDKEMRDTPDTDRESSNRPTKMSVVVGSSSRPRKGPGNLGEQDDDVGTDTADIDDPHTSTEESQEDLAGLRVIIIHVKDPLRDGPPIEDTILDQVIALAKQVGLSCEFTVSRSGDSYML
ncbi:hypothetical protein MMC25_002128 [Agyrium rufum]|nr:hypothetical protein [Agyrium rufum]